MKFYNYRSLYRLAWMLLLAIGTNTNGAELARFYDVGQYQSEHANLGLLEFVQPMTMLYEGDCWKNGSNLNKSLLTKTLPDNEEKILRTLKRSPQSPVLIDWESLPSGFFQRLNDEEVIARRNWYLTCMQHVRKLANENGCGDRAWGIYGGVPYYGAYPKQNQKGISHSLQLWSKTKPSLFEVTDFWSPDMALRYEIDGEWEAYETRCKQQASLAKLFPLPVFAMVKSRHHAVNSRKKYQAKELTMTGALKHLEITLKYFDGVIYWIPDAEKYGGPLSDRTRIGMLLAMDRLARQNNKISNHSQPTSSD